MAQSNYRIRPLAPQLGGNRTKPPEWEGLGENADPWILLKYPCWLTKVLKPNSFVTCTRAQVLSGNSR